MNHHNHRVSSIEHRASSMEHRVWSIENRESSYLRAYQAPLHLSRTLYKSTLFMQNKANFRKAQMNVSIFSKKAYENKSNWTLGENKPNSNPICQRVKLMQSLYLQRITKKNAANDYGKTKPKQTQFPKSQNERKYLYHKGL